MLARIADTLRAWSGCRRGITALEFALVSPILILSVIGIMEISMVLFVTTLMEGGLRQASRFGITGYLPDGVTREQIVTQIVSENTIGLLDVDGGHLTTYVYPDFDDIGKPEPFTDENGNGSWDEGEFYIDVNGNLQWDPDMGAAGLGGPGDVVLYTFETEWELMTPFFANIINSNGKIPLRASMAVRNEPYETPGGTP